MFKLLIDAAQSSNVRHPYPYHTSPKAALTNYRSLSSHNLKSIYIKPFTTAIFLGSLTEFIWIRENFPKSN